MRVLLPLLAAVMLASCEASSAPRSSTPAPAEPAPTPASPASLPSPDDPHSCERDEDCPRLACGPCEPGEQVLHRFTRINCYANPCPEAVAVCRDRVCIVR